MPCMCGATDCPSCGPAQGYDVRRVWSKTKRRFVHVVVDDASDDAGEPDFDEPDEPEEVDEWTA